MITQVLAQHGYKVSSTEALMSWIIRHAGWTIHRYRVMDSGRTSYETIKGKQFAGQIVEFGELVWAREPGPAVAAAKATAQWTSRIWLGKVDSSDEHLVAGSNGGIAEKARTCEITWGRGVKPQSLES